MRSAFGALRDFYRDPFEIAVGVVAGAAATVLFAWSGERVSSSPVGGVFWDLRPDRVAAVAALAVAFATVAPLQLDAVRRARASSRGRRLAGLAGSTVPGVAALSCCSPMLVPAVLSALGTSGSTIVTVNVATQRLFVPLAGVSLLLMTAAGVTALKSLQTSCAVPGYGPTGSATDVGAVDGISRGTSRT